MFTFIIRSLTELIFLYPTAVFHLTRFRYHWSPTQVLKWTPLEPTSSAASNQLYVRIWSSRLRRWTSCYHPWPTVGHASDLSRYNYPFDCRPTDNAKSNSLNEMSSQPNFQHHRAPGALVYPFLHKQKAPLGLRPLISLRTQQLAIFPLSSRTLDCDPHWVVVSLIGLNNAQCAKHDALSSDHDGCRRPRPMQDG